MWNYLSPLPFVRNNTHTLGCVNTPWKETGRGDCNQMESPLLAPVPAGSAMAQSVVLVEYLADMSFFLTSGKPMINLRM